MKTSRFNLGAQRPGFTLVEIITVIAIIMVLAAMTISGLTYVNKKAAVSRTEVFLGTVSQALEDYRSDEGEYPLGDGLTGSTELVYEVLYGDAQKIGEDKVPGAKVYLNTLDPNLKGKAKNVKKSGSKQLLVDAWKDDKGEYREIFYTHPGQMNPSSDFDLWSVGPDGEGGKYELGNPPANKKVERADDLKNW